MAKASGDVWYVIPSANPEKCRKTLPAWRERGYKIAILQNFARGDVPADRTIWYDYYPGWPESINILCRDVVPRDCDLVVSGGDDMYPDPKHTARELREQFYSKFPDGFGGMQPQGDEFMGSRLYCGSPFLGRSFWERMYAGRGAMCGQYKHSWADNELYWVSKGMGVLWERFDLTHFHEHFLREATVAPDYWSRASKGPDYWAKNVQAFELEDCLIYVKRKAAGFAGYEPVDGKPFPKLDTSILLHGNDCPADRHLMNPPARPSEGQTRFLARVEEAFTHLASMGKRSVALFGAGTHTRQIGAALAEPKIDIACIIDDRPELQGKRLWGYPIVSRDQALSLKVDAVVLSANTHEGQLWQRTRAFRDRGVTVLPLYTPPEKLEAAQASAA